MKIKIHNQSKPDRCEICHQSDQFNPDTGNCLRCADISIPINENAINRSVNEEDEVVHNAGANLFITVFGTLASLIIFHGIFHLNLFFTIFITLIIIFALMILINPMKVVAKGKYSRNIKYSLTDRLPYSLEEMQIIDNYTKELLGYGFLIVNDYKVDISKTEIYFRIFIHPSEHCLAEICQNQIDKSKWIINFTSYGDKNLSINTNNSKPSFIIDIFKLPYKINYFFENYNLAQLFHKHLEVRNQILSELNINLLVDRDINFFIAQAERQFSDSISRFEKTMFFTVQLKRLRYKLFPKNIIAGNYKKYIRKS